MSGFQARCFQKTSLGFRLDKKITNTDGIGRNRRTLRLIDLENVSAKSSNVFLRIFERNLKEHALTYNFKDLEKEVAPRLKDLCREIIKSTSITQ